MIQYLCLFAALSAFSSPLAAQTNSTFEVEKQPVVSFGAKVLKVADVNASGGFWEKIDSTAEGDSMVITTPILPADVYEVMLRYKSDRGHGVIDVLIDNEMAIDRLREIDQFGAPGYKTVSIGRYTLRKAGAHSIKLAVAGKNPASSGFVCSVDAITFISTIVPGVGDSSLSFSPPAGSSPDSSLAVTMTSFPSDATIRYTTDGSMPTQTHGSLYSIPVAIKGPTTLSAIAFRSGISPAFLTQSYSINTAPSFSMLATSPTLVTAVQGKSAQINLSFKSFNGFGGPLDMNSILSPASAATGTFTPVVLTPGGTATSTYTLTALPAAADFLNGGVEVTIRTTAPRIPGPFLSANFRTLVPRAGEAETIPQRSSGAPITVHRDFNASGLELVTLDAMNSSAFAEFTLQNIPAGIYSLKLACLAGPDRGLLTLSVDGAPLGATFDQYNEFPAYLHPIFGKLNLATAGNHIVRIITAGKNPVSSGFTLSADRILLTPTLTFEAENLSTSSTSATRITVSTDANTSGGKLVFINATAVGDTATFNLGPVPEGNYRVKLHYKANTNRGQATVSINGVKIGSISGLNPPPGAGMIDQHAAAANYPTVDMGLVAIATGGRSGTNSGLSFEVTGKSSASNAFTLTADSITLVGE